MFIDTTAPEDAAADFLAEAFGPAALVHLGAA